MVNQRDEQSVAHGRAAMPGGGERASASPEERIRALEQQREHDRRRRRQTMLVWGIALSLLVHLLIMGSLNTIYRSVPGGGGGEPVEVEFATLEEIELAEHESVDLDDTVSDDLSEIADSIDDVELAEMAVESPETQLDSAVSDAVDALGGSGDGLGGEGGLSGGGAGASFFGIQAGGNRFAFIADVSGSMSRFNRIERLQDELTRSLTTLADYSEFFVVLFSSGKVLPPMQDGWTRASPDHVQRYVRWIERLSPGGGTRPRSAFHEVFALSPRPDVVFFMTDGEITGFEAEEVAALNREGQHVTIHTIAFGDPSSQDLLKAIASNSGGKYRFVPSN